MAITRINPRTIWLGGHLTIVNDIPAGESIVPGHVVERSAGTWVKNATSGNPGSVVALDQSMLGKDYDEAYASGDLMLAGVGMPGTTFLAWLASGQNVADGAVLKTNNAGKLIAQGGSGTITFRALEAKNSNYPTGDTRIRVEVV